MTEGTRTPAQQRYENTWQRIQQFGHWLPNEIWAAVQIGKSGYERAEEVGTDVRALAATVAELKEELEDWTHLVHARLNTHSQMISKTGTDCDICEGRGWSINVPSQTMYPCSWCKGKGKVNIGALEYQRDRAEADADDLEQIRSRVLPQSPGSAEAALDPVCRCGHPKSSHGRSGTCRYIRPGTVGGPFCQCTGYVPAEQAVNHGSFGGANEYQEWIDEAVQEPPALDPVRLAKIRLLNMLTLTQVNALGEDDMKLIFGKVGDVHIEEHLRAYGKPGSHITMTVPEKTVSIRAYGADAREGGK